MMKIYLIFISLLFLLINSNNNVVVELTDSNFDKEMTEENWLIFFHNNSDCTFYESLLKWNQEKKLDLRLAKINAGNDSELMNSLNINNITAPFWIYSLKWAENFVLVGESNLDEVKNFVEKDYLNHSIPLVYELEDEEDKEDKDDKEDKEDKDDKEDEDDEKDAKDTKDNKKKDVDQKKDVKKDDKKDNKSKGQETKDNKKKVEEQKKEVKKETPVKVLKKEYKEVDRRAKKAEDKQETTKTENKENKSNDNKEKKEEKKEEEKKSDEDEDDAEDSDDKEEEFKWPVDRDTVVLTANNFERKTASGVWFIDFYAQWCPHCQELASVWAKLATRVKKEMKGKVNIAKVDVDKAEAVSSKYKVEHLPSLIFLKDGVIYTYEGDHNERDLLDFIKGGYKKAKSTKSSNEFVGRAADDSKSKKDNNAPPEENEFQSFINSFCGKKCQRVLLDIRFITLILGVLITIFVFLIYYKPSDQLSYVKKSHNRRKKKN